MRAGENQSFSDISADTAAFVLRGGKYGISATATWSAGSVTLEKLAGDGSTYVTAATAMTANDYVTVDLPPGTYKFAVATSTAVYLELQRVPGD